jgi:hypothetical protein
MTNLEMLEDSLNASVQAYIMLCDEEQERLQEDLGVQSCNFKQSLFLLQRVTSAYLRECLNKERQRKELEDSNEF